MATAMASAPASRLRVVATLLLIVFLLPAIARGQQNAHLRIEGPFLRARIGDIATKSVTMRRILNRLERSNVIAYVTCSHFSTTTLDGRTLWVLSRGGARYVRVQVECQLSLPRLVRILGHELAHVGEVAGATEVTDEPGFTRLFATIGFRTCYHPEEYETIEAEQTGDRVREEYFGNTAHEHGAD